MKRRNVMSVEVQNAVHDILHGVTVDSHTEWLQREYIRLMRREAAKQKENESKSKKNLERNNGHTSVEDRTIE